MTLALGVLDKPSVVISYGFTPASSRGTCPRRSRRRSSSTANSLTQGTGHWDLSRSGADWEVKICKGSGLTINQSKVIDGENYIVVNYKANSQVVRIWVLWEARDAFFSPKRKNSNARTLNRETAAKQIEVTKATAQGSFENSIDTSNLHGRSRAVYAT